MIHCKLGDFKIIVIYQYGKVGSATLGTNLCKWLGCKFVGTIFRPQPKYPKVCHIHSSEIMKDILQKYDSILIINATRNFYDRQISEFFQQAKNRQRIKNGDLEELSVALKNNSIYRLNNWYHEFEDLIGFNLKPFDYNKHYSLTKKPKITVLLVRLEDSKRWGKIFNRVVHQKIKFTTNTNVTSNRAHGDIYKRFKEYFKYSPEEVAKLDESDTHQRYYQDLGKLGLKLPINEVNENHSDSHHDSHHDEEE